MGPDKINKIFSNKCDKNKVEDLSRKKGFMMQGIMNRMEANSGTNRTSLRKKKKTKSHLEKSILSNST